MYTCRFCCHIYVTTHQKNGLTYLVIFVRFLQMSPPPPPYFNILTNKNDIGKNLHLFSQICFYISEKWIYTKKDTLPNLFHHPNPTRVPISKRLLVCYQIYVKNGYMKYLELSNKRPMCQIPHLINSPLAQIPSRRLREKNHHLFSYWMFFSVRIWNPLTQARSMLSLVELDPLVMPEEQIFNCCQCNFANSVSCLPLFEQTQTPFA